MGRIKLEMYFGGLSQTEPPVVYPCDSVEAARTKAARLLRRSGRAVPFRAGYIEEDGQTVEVIERKKTR